MEHEACMCCVALRYRHSPKTLLPHNLNLLSRALGCKYTCFQEHMSYLCQLMLDRGGQRHSDNRPFSKTEDESILALIYQTNESGAFDATSTVTKAPNKLPLPLSFVAVLHANGYLPQPSVAALTCLSGELKCTLENVTKKYKELETRQVLNEVAHQEQHNQSENEPECMCGFGNTVACIVRRARRYITAKCTDSNGNPPQSMHAEHNTSKKRSREEPSPGESTCRQKDTETLRLQLEKIFASAVHGVVDESEFMHCYCNKDVSSENTVEVDNFPYFAEHSDNESGGESMEVSSDGSNTSSVELTAASDESN